MGDVRGRSSLWCGVKWSYLFGQFCGLAKVHLVSVHAAFRVSALPKYAMSGDATPPPPARLIPISSDNALGIAY